MPIRELPDDDIREIEDLSEINLKPQTGEVTPATPFETIREMQDEENIFRLQPSDLEAGRQEDQRQRAVNVLVQKLQQQYIKDQQDNPDNWTLEQTKQYIKDNPAQNQADEMKHELMLERQETRLEIETERAKRKMETLSAYQAGPKTLKQTVAELMNQFTFDSRGNHRLPEEDAAHRANVAQMAQFYNLPEKVIEKNYSALTQAYRDQPESFASVVGTAAETGMIAPITAGLATHPLATAVGIGAWTALSEAENATVSYLKKEKYNFFGGKKVSELLPEEASEVERMTLDVLTFLGKMAASGGIAKGVTENAGPLWQRFTKDIITEYKLPSKLYFDVATLRGMSRDQFQNMFQKDMGLSNKEVGDIFVKMNKGEPVQVELPGETVTKLVDKPGWAAIKKGLRIKPFEKTLTIKPLGETSVAKAGQQALLSPAGMMMVGEVAPDPLQLPGSRKVSASDFVGQEIVKTRRAPESSVVIPSEFYDKAGSLMPRVAEKQIQLEGIIDGIARSMGDNVVFWGAQKSLSSTALKMFRKNKEGYIPKDSTRASIGLSSFQEYPDAIMKLREQGFEVENTLDKPLNQLGYRGVHATKDLGDGIHGEVQLHTKDSWMLKESWSDEVYRQWRLYEKDGKLQVPPEMREALDKDLTESFSRWENLVDREADQDLRARIAAAVSTKSGSELTISPSVPSNSFQVTPSSAVTTGQAPLASGVTSKTLPSGNFAKSRVYFDITKSSNTPIPREPKVVKQEEKAGITESKKSYDENHAISNIKEGGGSYYTTVPEPGPGVREVKAGSKGNIENSPLKLKFKKQGYISFPNEEILSPADVAVAFKELKNEAVERLYVVAMKGETPIAVEPVSIGNIYSAPANAFEIMPMLLAKGADSYYLVHNHPTGDPKPSVQDMRLSSTVQRSLQKHDVEFKGHVIINDTHYGLIDNAGETAVLEGYTTSLKSGPKKVPVYTKYIEWLQGKTDLQQIRNADDIFNLVKGMNVDMERNAAVFYMNYQNRVLGVEMLPNSRNEFPSAYNLRLGRSIEAGAAALRSVNIIIANAKLPQQDLSVIHEALNQSGINLLDSIEFKPGSDGSLNVYTSAADKGQLGEEVPEYTPGVGEEVVPLDPAKAEKQTVEQWNQKREGIRLSLEGARAGLSDTENIRTHFLHRITKFDEGWMKEEMSSLPLIYRKASGGIKPDEALAELKRNFDIELADEQEMAEFFKSLEASRKEYLSEISAQEQELKDLSANPPGKERKFIKTVRDSDKTPEDVAAKVESFYDPITNPETLEEAKALIAADYNAALERVMGPGRTDTLTNAIGLVLLNKANTEGRTTDAVNLAERLAEKNTELGQAVQALSMYNRLSPEGILLLATRTVKRAQDGIEQKQRIINFDKLAKDMTPEERDALAKKLKIPHLSEDLAKQLTDMAKEIQAMPDGREKDIQTALMLKKIADLVPRNLLSKISMLQTLAQLLNPKTAVRNILGNLGFLAVENISDYVGAGLDMAASLFTGKRTVWTPAFYDQIKGGLQGGKEGLEEALLGIDLREMGRQFDLPKNGVFDSKVMKGFEKLLNITLKVPDRAFYQAAFNQSIARQTRAAGLEEPTAEMIERAHLLGLYRTFQDDNAISRLFVNLKRTLNLRKGWGLGDMVLKYPKTPGNLLARGVEYSPFGLVKSLWILGKAALRYPFEQEDFSRSTSRAFVGSALLVAVGAFLAGLGIITGKRERDKDAAALKAQTGIREYQINTSALKRFIMSGMDYDTVSLRVDDTLTNYDWFQPSSLGLALGANMVLTGNKSIVDQTLNMGERLLEAVNTLEEQPLLQGLKVMANKQSFGEGLSETIQGIPASFVPTLFNQVRQLTDNTARNTKDPNYFAEMYNRVKLRVPGVSKSLPEQVDTLGKTKEMYQAGSNNPFNVFLNPAFVSKYKPDPVAEMVLDIWQHSGETIHFPRVAAGKIKLGSQTREPVELTPSQYMEFQKYIGRKTDVLFSILAANEKFRTAPAELQAKKLQGFLTDIYAAGKIEVLGHRPKRVPKDVIAIIKAIGVNKKEIENNELREVPDEAAIREIPDE